MVIAVSRLEMSDAHELAPLIAAYAQDRKRGAPRAADEFYAELLLKDRMAEMVGARLDGELVGFALFFDLPEAISGMRAGQLEDLFVAQSARGRRIGQTLVAAVGEEGRRRGWSHIRWMVPERPATARRLAERLAEKGGWANYRIDVARAAGATGAP